ncbi:LAFA_0D11342g1_1 [Lachancea sp. 'fantastica']|nr:LAFA_0D11342g1_1 [Lachancea sp. 'fantastica']
MKPAVDDSRLETELVKKAIKNWDLNRLLGLQEEVTREIADRVQVLENEIERLKERPDLSNHFTQHIEHDSGQNGGHPLLKIEENENANLREEEDRHQMSKKRKISNSGHETKNQSAQSSQALGGQEDFLIPGTLDMQSKDINFSSPLKPAQTVEAKFDKSSPIRRRHLAVISDSEGELEWSDTEDQEPLDPGTIQVKAETEGELHAALANDFENESPPRRRKYTLNENPFSKKPWIFEDFKANDSIAASVKPGVSASVARISRFQSAAGIPVLNQKLVLNPHKGFELVNDNRMVTNANGKSDGIDGVFDNLRQRSKSPPGYGRLDFPNTQENDADIVKSREILYNKTKDRFLMATRSDLSPSKRGFVFRNMQLNDIVNEGDFEWDLKSLQIFSRAKVRK